MAARTATAIPKPIIWPTSRYDYDAAGHAAVPTIPLSAGVVKTAFGLRPRRASASNGDWSWPLSEDVARSIPGSARGPRGAAGRRDRSSGCWASKGNRAWPRLPRRTLRGRLDPVEKAEAVAPEDPPSRVRRCILCRCRRVIKTGCAVCRCSRSGAGEICDSSFPLWREQTSVGFGQLTRSERTICGTDPSCRHHAAPSRGGAGACGRPADR